MGVGIAMYYNHIRKEVSMVELSDELLYAFCVRKEGAERRSVSCVWRAV